MSAINTILNLLSNAGTKSSKFPPTLLYEEGWMMRLTLEWYMNNPKVSDHDLSIPLGNSWYSEALLPSPFLNGSGVRENHTHADGVVGMFEIGKREKGELGLKPNSDFLYVVEAKMGSKLSPNVTNAHGYNQAARNVACIVDLLVDGQLIDKKFTKLAFYVLMPNNNEHYADTCNLLDPCNIEKTIKERLDKFPAKYDRPSTTWLRNNLNTFVHNMMEIKLLNWDDVMKGIKDPDLQEFYELCKKFNGVKCE